MSNSARTIAPSVCASKVGCEGDPPQCNKAGSLDGEWLTVVLLPRVHLRKFCVLEQ